MKKVTKSRKLDNVCYDIRGAVAREAARLEEEGHRIVKLNTGNPAAFGLGAPEELILDLMSNLPYSQGYIESKGLFSARKAVMQECQRLGIRNVDVNDVFIGNGVSELIVMAMQGLLNDGDEILIPSPDYPLWTAASTLSGGCVRHYICDESAGWEPNLEDIESKITKKTKAIVVINPNNPTGSVYSRSLLEGILEIARRHSLIVFSDEIYQKITYTGTEAVSLASLADDLFFVTFNGLSKSYRAAGFRVGWMTLSGNKRIAKDYIEGLEILATMRLCSNVPTQHVVQTALGGYQSINDLVKEGGRLRKQRDICYEAVKSIPGLSCVKPEGALYLFPKIDPAIGIVDDERFALDLLIEKKILIVQGKGFNYPDPDHFRIVFLPHPDDLAPVMEALGDFLSHYTQK